MNKIIDFKLHSSGLDELYKLKHSHANGYEILFVHSGSGSIIIKDKLLNLTPGVIYFINGSETHCTVPDNPDGYSRSLLIMESQLVDKICRITGADFLLDTFFRKNGGISVSVQKETLKKLEEIFMQMNTVISQNKEYTTSYFTASFLNIMHLCYEDTELCPKKENGIIDNVLDYINEHLSENILLDDICQTCHISRFYLCHTFRKTLGMTISSYILSRRLSKARQLLKYSNMSISEIAENCGFTSPSYFSMVFKKELGAPPSFFR